MTTLTIKDLSVAAADLDSRAMSAVRGGTNFGYKLPIFDLSSMKVSNDVTQYTAQDQATEANTGVNAAWMKNVHANVKPTQDATTNSYLNIGH
jgi:hypothetical protein